MRAARSSASGRVVEAEYSARSSATARSALLVRWPNGKTARSKSGRTPRAPQCCATGSPRARAARAQVTVLHRQGSGAYGTHRRRCGFRCLGHRHAPSRPHRAVQWPREDEFGASPVSPRWRSSFAPCSRDNKPLDWTIELWSPPHAQRARHERQLQPDRRRGAAHPPPPNPLSDVPDERGGRATRNAIRSTICRATG